MRFSFSWLKEHVNINMTVEQLSDKLTNLGLEVESIENTNKNYENFYVCKILKTYKHPNADRLKICEITYGQETYKVVCGASNAIQGLKTIFAPNGTFIPGTNFKLEKKSIRGIIGDGMLCSEKELGFKEQIDGIIELDKNYEVGNTLSYYMKKDFIFDVGLTPNRGDCASVRGMARDLSASLNINMIKRKINELPGTFESSINWNLKELNNKNDCPLIYGRHFTVINNLSSPNWLKKRLESIGLKPISSLVDITNYVLFDLGRPLHVFDLKKIKGNLKVVCLENEETFIGLDKKEYKLEKGDIVIKDSEKTVSLAGIIGGLNSSVDENTKEVFLEVAYFCPNKISQTGRRLGIISDARYRFERGIDPDGLIEGLEYSTRLIFDICGGSFSNITKSGTDIQYKKEIEYDCNSFESLVGYNIIITQQKDILNKLKFTIKKANKNLLTIVPPSWRHDISSSNDIVEEILRLDGYNNIPEKKIPHNLEIKKSLFTDNRNFQINIREALARLGLFEVITFSFISEKKIIPVSSLKNELRIENPISVELGIMRNSLLPNLLDIASRNFSRGIDTTEIFEVGFTYDGLEEADQKSKFGLLLSGSAFKKNWHFQKRDFDFFDVKSILLLLLEELKIVDYTLVRSQSEWFHPGIAADIVHNGNLLMSFGALHPNLYGIFKIKKPTILCEGNLNNISKIASLRNEKKSLILYPFLPLKKDFAFVIENKNNVQTIINEIKSADKSIGEVSVFDIYKNESSNETSVGIEVEIIQSDKVLDAKEINVIMEKIINRVENNAGAKLRLS